MPKPPEQKYLIHSFGRRQGRALHPNAKRLVDKLLPKLTIDCERFDLSTFFPQAKSLRLEIGFGGGEHLAAQARANPDVGFIGCEPYINGVAKLLAEIECDNMHNIRLFTDDARLLIKQLPAGSVSHIDILFPDPWPKLRHHKRRLVSLETLAMLHRIQPPGGALQLATDHIDYAAHMLEVLRDSPHYDWQADSKTDWQSPPQSWTGTRYQRKTSAEGRAPVFLLAKRA